MMKVLLLSQQRVHGDRIRIVRRLGFEKQSYFDAPHDEHAKILKALRAKR
jgi:hypothetical protein